jgi:hypothetical protein
VRDDVPHRQCDIFSDRLCESKSQPFKGAYKVRMYIRIFIRMNTVHMSIYVYTMFLKNKKSRIRNSSENNHVGKIKPPGTKGGAARFQPERKEDCERRSKVNRGTHVSTQYYKPWSVPFRLPSPQRHRHF